VDNAHGFLAGVDEAGRGPLAGPVVAAAVVLGTCSISGIGDSKKISEKNRESLVEEIKAKCVAYAVGSSSPVEIDCLNIHNATLLAMKRAIIGLRVPLKLVMVDGKFTPNLPLRMENVVRGDEFVEDISAASILAKVTRDKIMCKYHLRYSDFDFHKHKGYPTRLHLKALRNHGLCPIHRISFRPVKAVLSEEESTGQ
jgi:ribonuclease HII